MEKRFIFLLFFFCSLTAYSQVITTIAGNGVRGYEGDAGPAVAAELSSPAGVAIDAAGNLYIGDRSNSCVRKVSPSGIITTFAGTGVGGYSGDGGPATMAQLSFPMGVALDREGNVYVAEMLNDCVRKINTSGIISTYAGKGMPGGYTGDGGPATAAKLSLPVAVALDSAGNLYIADGGNAVIRKVNTAGIISTFAGNGTAYFGEDSIPATVSSLDDPNGVAVDNLGNVYISDNNSNRVRKVDNSGIITTIAGNGTQGFSGDGGSATLAELHGTAGITVDYFGNIYICDCDNNRIRKVNSSGIITTIAGGGIYGLGDGGPATNCELNIPTDVAVDKNGSIYIADFGNNRIRYIRNTTSVNTVSNNTIDLIAYPNPNQGVFTINLTSIADEGAMIFITNSIGEKVKEAVVKTNDPEQIKMDVVPGVYFIAVIAGNEVYRQQIVVIK